MRRPALVLGLSALLVATLAVPQARAASFNRAMVLDSGVVRLAVSVDSIAAGEGIDLSCMVRVSKSGVPVDSFAYTPYVQNPVGDGGGPAWPLCAIPHPLIGQMAVTSTYCVDYGCASKVAITNPVNLNDLIVCYDLPDPYGGVDCKCGQMQAAPPWTLYANGQLEYTVVAGNPGLEEVQYDGDLHVIPGSSPTLLLYDGFDYSPAGAAVSTYPGGGHGWYGEWNGAQTVVGTGLKYVATPTIQLQVRGGALQSSTETNVRRIATPTPLGNGTGTVWFSMLAKQTSATVGGTWAGLTLPCTGPKPLLFFGKPFGQPNWGLDLGGTMLQTSVPATQQAFLVMRVDFKSGNDDVYLWVNPVPGIEPSLGSAALTSIGGGDFQGITQVSLASNTAALLDEVRAGRTYLDVAPPARLRWFGRVHRPIGIADLVVDGSNRLVVFNLGTSGLDGFDVETGSLSTGGMSLTFAAGASSFGGGHRVEVSGIGDVGDSLGVLLGKAALYDIGGGVSRLDFTQRPELGASFTAQVYKRGALVASVPGHGGTGITFQPVAGPQSGAMSPVRADSPGDPYSGLDITLVKKPAGTIASVDLRDSSSIDLGAGAVVGDRIVLRSTPPSPTPAVVQHLLSVRASNVSAMAFESEGVTLGTGSYVASGDPVLVNRETAGPSSRPAIAVGKSPFGGPFGLKARKSQGSGTTGITLDLEKSKPSAPGSETRYKSRGDHNGSPDQPLGEAWWSIDAGLQALNADFSALGAGGTVVEVFSGGVPVSSTTVPGAGVVAMLDSSASVVRVKCLDGQPFDFRLSAAVSITPTGGAGVTGDRIRVGPASGPAPLRAARADAVTDVVRELEVVATGLDSFLVYLDTPAPTTDVGPSPAVSALRLAIDRVYSNPSPRGIRVALVLPSGERAQVDVLDVQGRRVFETSLTGAAGQRFVDLDPRGTLPSGIYLLRVTQGGRSATGRAVIVR